MQSQGATVGGVPENLAIRGQGNVYVMIIRKRFTLEQISVSSAYVLHQGNNESHTC